MADKKTPSKRKSKKQLLGIGFDNKDGHLRVTKGENFQLIGGSEETHAVMQEKAIKFNEQMRRRGKTLDTLSREEFHELADRVGMPLLEKPTHRAN
ncbi:MAG: hypothetical protein NZ483_09690 [Verrucomicrobiae bacterium]|nr:hypothetical protein [Verrucomicrobiae bacterium]MDW8342994.1 hypothetical protein [Verrucomicrobiae bacterium]